MKWFYISSQEVIVLYWNPQTEELEISKDIAQTERLIAAVNRLEFDRGLAPYPRSHYDSWIFMTSHITRSVLENVVKEAFLSKRDFSSKIQLIDENERLINSQSQPQLFQQFVSKPPLRRELPREKRRKEEERYLGTDKINFTIIPSFDIPPEASPELITALKFETTRLIELLLAEGSQKYSFMEKFGSDVLFYYPTSTSNERKALTMSQSESNSHGVWEVDQGTYLKILKQKQSDQTSKPHTWEFLIFHRNKNRGRYSPLATIKCPFVWILAELQIAFVS